MSAKVGSSSSSTAPVLSGHPRVKAGASSAPPARFFGAPKPLLPLSVIKRLFFCCDEFTQCRLARVNQTWQKAIKSDILLIRLTSEEWIPGQLDTYHINSVMTRESAAERLLLV